VHELPLLVNIAVALGAALVGGVLARLVGVPAIVGYLLAGVAIGPFTPGFVGDVSAIGQLAELGVIFLMFGVGLHFSLRDLWRVREVAVPGALGQMAIATGIGYVLTRAWGWPANASLVLGLAISVASTVVAIHRDGSVLPGPAPETRLQPGDRLGLIGTAAHVEAAETLLRAGGAVG
jgi:CPA2 family monovalent cation:H+ antiporter-2